MDRPVKIWLVRGRTCIGWMALTARDWRKILERIDALNW
jgi:hypothetical protein